ncbi:unnamed protein product [Closterium sp. Naga37s-1]|nr:unnamed protein product [Closterium sp. Naga37s-1]
MFRENVSAWDCFQSRADVFPAFFNRVLALKDPKRKAGSKRARQEEQEQKQQEEKQQGEQEQEEQGEQQQMSVEGDQAQAEDGANKEAVAEGNGAEGEGGEPKESSGAAEGEGGGGGGGGGGAEDKKEVKEQGQGGSAVGGGEGGYELSIYERVNYIVFIIHCFQSLENPLVRACVLPLVSLPLWHALSPARRERELHPHAHLLALWARLLKRDAKNRHARMLAVAEGGEKRAEAEAAERKERRGVRFLPGLILEFFAVSVLDEVVEKGPDYEDDQSESAGVLLERAVDQPRLLFCERFLELLIDLLSQLPTRRFFRPVVDDMAVAARCRLSRLYRHPRGRLFVQLVDLLRFYARFQMDDHAGRQLDEEEVDREHCARVSALQLFLFNKVPEVGVTDRQRGWYHVHIATQLDEEEVDREHCCFKPD